MTINVKGVDGSNFAFPDGTPEGEITGAMARHYGEAPAGDAITTNKVVRAAATGVPIIGGLLNQADAATNAALAPVLNPLFDEKDQLKGATFAERRREALRIQNEGDKRFSEDHPVVDTAAKIAGGVGGSIPAMMAAPAAFGLTGTLPQMVTRGALSNAAVGGADAAVRGEDPGTAAAVGGVVGAAAPLVARGVGHLVRGVKEYRNPTPPVAQNVEKVAGVDIPMNDTLDPAIEARKEIMRRGAGGGEAEAIARQADDEAQRAVAEASGNIGRSLDPTGVSPRTAPQAAGEVVQSELAAQAQARQAAEAAQATQVDAEGRTLSRDLGGGAAPVSPFDAAESTGAAVAAARAVKEAEKNAAYKARDAVEGTWSPEFTGGLAADVRKRISTGDASQRIHVDPVNESIASKALKAIDDTVGNRGLFRNDAAPRASAEDLAKQAGAKELADTMVAQGIHPDKAIKAAADAYGIHVELVGATEKPPAIDLRTLDDARKQLSTMYGDAKSVAFNTGKKDDLRAMARILHEFDNAISDGLANGHFSGDAKMASELQSAARKSFSELKQTFSSRGPGDEIGRNVEKILGRYSDTAATPEEIAKMSYGPHANPGTGAVVKTALRLRSILGEKSPEWAQYKQGLFAHVDDASLSPAKRAARIDNFLNTSLAKGVLSDAERGQFASYAKNLRAAEPRGGPVNEVEKAVARIAGTDGHLPASPTEVADMLFSRAGKGDKGLSVRLALRLKNDLKPESWSAVRQGMWEKLTNAGEGKIEFGPQALSQRLHEFLNESGKPLARVLFSVEERAEMAKLASIYKRMTPLKGTTNPSGTAPMLAKIAKKASGNVLALIGLGAHGVSGALVGHAIQRGAEGLKDARAGKEAVRLFFGPQARRPVVSGRLPQLIGAPAIEASQR